MQSCLIRDRDVGLTVKYIVCGEMHQLYAQMVTCVSYGGYCLMVDSIGFFRMILCSVYGCVCGAVYQYVNAEIGDGLADGFFVADVEVGVSAGMYVKTVIIVQ